jgi:hypothetical protein
MRHLRHLVRVLGNFANLAVALALGCGGFASARTEIPGDNAAPIVELLVPAAGSALRELYVIEVHFSEPVAGVEADDLLINGAAATNVTEVVPGLFVFSFPAPADGLVAVNWRLDHGITDREDPPHLFAGGGWTYTLDSTGPAPGVLISEFMADNGRTLNDEDGESSDWIELFNSGETQASLYGWFLTDAATNLTRWRFPNVALPPNGFLVIFASGKDKTNTTGRLHTDFRLAKEGGYLALVSPLTNIISAFAPAYPRQYADVSYGRDPGGPQTLGYFTKPTPGAPNQTGGPGFAPAVGFSRTSGTFMAPFELTLSAGAPDVVVRFTLDGNMPTNTSPVYVAPIRVTNSAQVRARGFQAGFLPGPVCSEAYLLLSSNLLSFTSDLPVMILNTLGKGAPTASRYAFAHVSVYEPVNGQTSLTNPPTFAARAGLKLRGSSTEGYGKSSFALELWDEFNLDQDQPLLDLPAESDWVLYAPNNFEPVLIHNPFVHQLSRDMQRYSPRTRFVEVYLNRTGGPVSSNTYNGIYVLEEKIKIGPDRVDIDRLEPEHLKAPEVTGGYLLKIDRLDPGDTGLSAGGQSMACVDPKERDIKLPQRDPQEQYIKNYFNAFAAALNGSNWRDPVVGYPAYVDVAAWIDYHTLEVLSGNVDALVLSTYFHKPRNGKLVFGPHWDFDRALGSTDGRDANPRLWNTGPFFSPNWWSRLFRDPDFWQQWVDRWQELRRSHFANTNLNALIDRLANEVRQAQPRERQKWRVALRGGSYQSEINLMKNWLSNRMDFIDKQLAQPPRLSAEGGLVPVGSTVTLAGQTNDTVYYTLDGSDPRLSQGAVSPRAAAYTGPVPIAANTRIVARARNLNARQTGGPPISTPWSGPVAATFTVKPPPLIATELMFHPVVSPASTNAESDFEFIELKNLGAEPVNLVGYSFTNGIMFTFTATNGVTNLLPGERLVLVKNRTAFSERYPAVTNIVGEFERSLANSNDRLALVGPLLEPVLDFVYGDHWYPLADGFGFSLVLVDETISPGQLDRPESWRLSSAVGGSPGRPDPPPPNLPPVFVNELLAHPSPSQEDSVELFNPNAFALDLSGWFISDEFSSPKKFRVPDGVWIAAHGYSLFSSDDFSNNAEAPFAFSRFGEEVYLFSANTNGVLTGWFHGFAFDASEEGRTFGRHVTSTGAENFVAQVWPTLGRANAGPRVGPVVISEIMFYPPPNGVNDNTVDEFIELQNLAGEPLRLLDPAHPANAWRLRGGVDFDFPTNAILPACGGLLLVSFDPRTDQQALAAFRFRYSVVPGTPVLGPWRGQLGNAGGSLRLLKPDEPQTPPSPDAGQVPYVLVEQIDYSGALPWPTAAAGTGLSLQRQYLNAYGNDPANWLAEAPQPGLRDSDGDGLPDSWELANNLNPFSAWDGDGATGDADGDGFTNLQEFISGTNPRAPASYLRLEVTGGAAGKLTLSFMAGPDRTYTLLCRDNPATGQWQVLRTLNSPPGGGPLVVTEVATNVARCYRLQTP